MLQDIKLPRLDAYTALVGADATATSTFSIWWNQVATQLEDGVNGINEAINAAAAAQLAADGAQTTADGAQTSADTAQTTATAAQSTANGAVSDAAAAQATANSANTLAGTKVTKDVGPNWSGSSGTASRGGYSSYAAPVVSNPPTQTEVQNLANAVQDVSQHMVAMISDLRGNHALTN